jgi:hypothetical protein
MPEKRIGLLLAEDNRGDTHLIKEELRSVRLHSLALAPRASVNVVSFFVREFTRIFANPNPILYWSGISRTLFEPRRHEDTEKNKGKTPCPCVSVVKGSVRPLSDDYKSKPNSRRFA